nr:MobF family relaxase [Pseudonocardia sp. C8]
MVLKVVNGYSPEYLLKEVAAGRENYYTGAVAEGEPPGRWWGAGAEKLGLTGLVDAQDMRALYGRFLDPRADGFRDPQRWDEVATLGPVGRRYVSEDELYASALEQEPYASAERRAELRTAAGKRARHNVAFLDATFSVQKSVTLLHTAFEAEEVAARRRGDEETAAAWGEFRVAVEDAIWAGNNAALAYLADKAGYSRVGHHGGAAGRWVDAHDWVVGSFFQHDSRDRDPQLHVHNTILNRVEGPDGQWRTLDSRAVHRWRTGAGAVGERTCEERIVATIGTLFATRPDGKAREIVGVPAEAMALISNRRRAVTAKAQQLVEAFEQRYGRAPNGYEHERLCQQATLVTRKPKSQVGETREDLMERIGARMRADIDGGLAAIADAALRARQEHRAPAAFDPQAVIELALEEVKTRKPVWTRSDLTRAVNNALPDYLGVPDGRDVAVLLDQLTDAALEYAVPVEAERPGHELLPDDLRLADGRSAYLAPGGKLYATPDQLHTERILLASTTARDGAARTPRQADRFLADLRASGIELGVDQAAAVRGILTSGARVETLVGPAGTGKSFVVGVLARGWTAPAGVDTSPGRAPRVFGLATSQIATEVLAGEGLTARNVASWLGVQDRLHPGAAEQTNHPSDERWRLREGDLVVVDESAMTNTDDLAAIHARVEAAGAKLLLVGDHRQLAAIGAGGGMDLLAASGNRYELAEARRFTAPWERAASLRLRDCDESVLRDYHRQGRILDAGTVEEAEASAARAWLADTLDGHRSLLLVGTNEQADRLSAQLRGELVRLGLVAEHGVWLGRQGVPAGVGDLLQARRNDWDLAGLAGNRRGPMNRETFRITAVSDDGSVEVTTDTRRDGPGERLVLPAAYVERDLALGYAGTVHAAQGATVDTTHAVISPTTGPAALYVAMSRGRHANTAHVTTRTAPDDPADGSPHRHELRRDPVAVLATILDTADHTTPRAATQVAEDSAAAAASTRTAAELLADAATFAATERTAATLDRLATDGALTGEQRDRLAAEDGAATLTRVLRRAELAGLNPDTVLTDAVQRGPLTGSRNLTNVLYSRIRDAHRFDPVGETWADYVPRTDNSQWRAYLNSLALAADARTVELGEQTALNPPGWATAALGPVPDDLLARAEWCRDAGRVAAYRELRGHDDPTEALGPAPKPGQVEQFAAYRAAWRTLGRPEIEREQLELSTGQLRMRVRAYERELAAAPRYVANELAGTRQAAADHTRTAALRRAQADAATDPDERAQLLDDATRATSLAALLAARAEQLQEIDDARGHWLVHTAQTRVQADLSRAELSARGAEGEPDDRVTAAEWLAAHDAAITEEERHREITEDDILSETPAQRCALDDEVTADEQTATNRTDIREMADSRGPQVREDAVRVPDTDETADHLDYAGRVLEEIRYRESAEKLDAERAIELARWHDERRGDNAVRDDHVDEAAGLRG